MKDTMKRSWYFDNILNNREDKVDMYSLLENRKDFEGCFHLAFNSQSPTNFIMINGKKMRENCPKCLYYDEFLGLCYYIHCKLKDEWK